MKFKLRINNRITDHLINAFLIFASVFLAFWLNEIRIENKEVQITKDAKNAILTEFKINLLVLERWAPYHEAILKKGRDSVLGNLANIKKFDPNSIPGLSKGIQREILTSNGWSLIDDRQINLDIKTRMLINQIYEQQKFVTNATSKLANDFLMQRELFDESKTKENYFMFYTLLGELLGQETAMIHRLKYAIEEFEK